VTARAHVTIDRPSLLAEVDATMTVGACEDALHESGLTLDLAAFDRATPIGIWLARGAAGARDPWSDPADHLVAGLEATMNDGTKLSIRPTPRRAVGPDLIALVVGMNDRYARIDRVWLRVHARDDDRARVHPLVADRNPPVNDDESKLLDAIERALRA
jgi:alkyldihydroxyacetonephosphate synthase